MPWPSLPSYAPVPVLPLRGEGAGLSDAWPLQTFLELGALPSAVSCARLHACHVLREWELFATFGETVELIVSELVTNAVQASVGLTASRYAGHWAPGVPPVRLWLFSDRRRVLVRVWDSDHRMPKLQNAELDAEGGRGLLLVESLSTGWGSYLPDNSSGKVVWALVAEAAGL